MGYFADTLQEGEKKGIMGNIPLVTENQTIVEKIAIAFKSCLDQVDFNLLQRDVLLHPGSEENKPVIDTYKTLMEKAMEFVRPNISKEEVASISETLLEFEGQLANFPLLKLLNREFSMADITLNETEYLDFYAMSYYSKLTEFLHQVKPDVLFNYAGFRMVISLGEYASKEIRNALSEVEYIVEKLTESFSKIVQSSDWMDDHTKKIALEKLIKMKSKIGYPLRLTSTDYIDELYNRVPPVTLQNSFLYIWDKILESNYINNLKQLHENHDEDAE
ncbi:hypothetical protein HPB49_006280 [Dermacentor silvarum]|uniref:Uncharacterized protein n=1 Tax=Dermacentor silvarum TaxID=543639 RepID=A0ACB8C7T9_DERSI|nr:hypothetical protein HPB49_006280 [Dermacentor silvarum]